MLPFSSCSTDDSSCPGGVLFEVGCLTNADGSSCPGRVLLEVGMSSLISCSTDVDGDSRPGRPGRALLEAGKTLLQTGKKPRRSITLGLSSSSQTGWEAFGKPS